MISAETKQALRLMQHKAKHFDALLEALEQVISREEASLVELARGWKGGQ